MESVEMNEINELVKFITWFYPGFLSMFILTFLIRELDWKKDLFGVLVYSYITYFLIDVIYKLTSCSWIVENKVFCSSGIAILLALLTIIFLSYERVRKFILKTRNEIFMTAWDASWKRMYEESPVICEVYLKNSKIPIVGVFASNSVSSFSYRKDGIFLEKVLTWNSDEENLTIDESSLGIFIPHEEIKYIKFYKFPMEEGHE